MRENKKTKMTRYKRLTFDEKIDISLQQMMHEMKKLGIKPVSKTLALKKIIEMNDAARIKIIRKRRSKNGLIYR